MKFSRQLSLTAVLMCSTALLFSNVFVVECEPNCEVEYHACSDDKYDPNSGYGKEIDKGLDDMTYDTCKKVNYQYILTGTYAVGNAYCSVDLSDNDCIICLEVAQDYLRGLPGMYEECEYSVSGSITLGDCGMSYAPINSGPSIAPSVG